MFLTLKNSKNASGCFGDTLQFRHSSAQCIPTNSRLVLRLAVFSILQGAWQLFWQVITMTYKILTLPWKCGIFMKDAKENFFFFFFLIHCFCLEPVSCHFWAALKKAQAPFPDFFLLSFFLSPWTFPLLFMDEIMESLLTLHMCEELTLWLVPGTSVSLNCRLNSK